MSVSRCCTMLARSTTIPEGRRTGSRITPPSSGSSNSSVAGRSAEVQQCSSAAAQCMDAGKKAEAKQTAIPCLPATRPPVPVRPPGTSSNASSSASADALYCSAVQSRGTEQAAYSDAGRRCTSPLLQLEARASQPDPKVGSPPLSQPPTPRPRTLSRSSSHPRRPPAYTHIAPHRTPAPPRPPWLPARARHPPAAAPARAAPARRAGERAGEVGRQGGWRGRGAGGAGEQQHHVNPARQTRSSTPFPAPTQAHPPPRPLLNPPPPPHTHTHPHTPTHRHELP